jgi:hypothetical protein
MLCQSDYSSGCRKKSIGRSLYGISPRTEGVDKGGLTMRAVVVWWYTSFRDKQQHDSQHLASCFWRRQERRMFSFRRVLVLGHGHIHRRHSYPVLRKLGPR